MPTIRQMIKEYSEMKGLSLPPSQVEELFGYQIFKLWKENDSWLWGKIFYLFNWIDEKVKLSSRS